MHNDLGFVFLKSEDSADSQAILIAQNKEKLVKIRGILLYEIPQRQITVKNLSSLDSDLRAIIRSVDESASIKYSLSSKDEFVKKLQAVIRHLNVAADYLAEEDEKNKSKNRDKVYQRYDEAIQLLGSAIRLLN